MEMNVKVTGTKTMIPEDLPRALGFPEGTTVKFEMNARNTEIEVVRFDWAMAGVMDVDKLNRLSFPPDPVPEPEDYNREHPEPAPTVMFEGYRVPVEWEPFQPYEGFVTEAMIFRNIRTGRQYTVSASYSDAVKIIPYKTTTVLSEEIKIPLDTFRKYYRPVGDHELRPWDDGL